MVEKRLQSKGAYAKLSVSILKVDVFFSLMVDQ